MPYDVENLLELICCLHFFGEVSVKVFGPLSNCIVFVLLHFRSSLHILDHSSLSGVFWQIFSPHLWLVFLSSWNCLFAEQMPFNFNEVQLLMISFMDHVFGVVSAKSLPYPTPSGFFRWPFSISYLVGITGDCLVGIGFLVSHPSWAYTGWFRSQPKGCRSQRKSW